MSSKQWHTTDEWKDFIDSVLSPQDRDELITQAHSDMESEKENRRAIRSDSGLKRMTKRAGK